MPKRPVQDIIRDRNDAQQLYDRLLMEIGDLYARYYRTKDDSLQTTIADKVAVFQKVEAQMRTLENELKQGED
jgi:hypothetical protein